VRVLVVAADYPWPATGGSRVRLSNTLASLARSNDVDFVSIVPRTRDASDIADPPSGIDLAECLIVRVDLNRPRPVDALSTLLRSSNPLELPVSPGAEVKKAVDRLTATRNYDVVWFFTVRAWEWSGEPHIAPTVVDIDDLEDQKILERLALPRDPQTSVVRKTLGAAYFRFEAKRWQSIHRRISRNAVPVLCSETDVLRSGLKNARVIPNGYRAPTTPRGHLEPGTVPTVLLQGTLRYPPNADAARFLSTEIAPLLRARVPAVQIRLAGTPPVHPFGFDPEIVTVVGRVDDMGDELAKADLVAVPLRFGSGTRIKILEAFAHRVPVVTTSLGAEGLELRDGIHVLIADGAGEFAQACATLLSDTGLRMKLIENAHALYLERYQLSVVGDRIEALAGEVASAR
jgi:glycosyltransferase involved in cell wall biosynthesis